MLSPAKGLGGAAPDSGELLRLVSLRWNWSERFWAVLSNGLTFDPGYGLLEEDRGFKLKRSAWGRDLSFSIFFCGWLRQKYKSHVPACISLRALLIPMTFPPKGFLRPGRTSYLLSVYTVKGWLQFGLLWQNVTSLCWRTILQKQDMQSYFWFPKGLCESMQWAIFVSCIRQKACNIGRPHGYSNLMLHLQHFSCIHMRKNKTVSV